MSEVEDKTTEIIDDKGNETPSGDDTGTPAGIEDDPKYKTAIKDQEFLQGVMEDYDLKDPDDLRVFIDNMHTLKGKIAGNDLDELIGKAGTLDKYQAYWAEQEEDKLRDSESDDETVARYKKERDEARATNMARDDTEKEIKESKRLVKEFNSEIKGFLDKQDVIPKEYFPFVSKLMGVDNPSNEVELGDKKAIKGMATQMLKDFQNLEQLVIKRYRDGKTATPKITPVEDAPKDKEDSIKPKTIKEAGRMAKEGPMSKLPFFQKR